MKDDTSLQMLEWIGFKLNVELLLNGFILIPEVGAFSKDFCFMLRQISTLNLQMSPRGLFIPWKSLQLVQLLSCVKARWPAADPAGHRRRQLKPKEPATGAGSACSCQSQHSSTRRCLAWLLFQGLVETSARADAAWASEGRPKDSGSERKMCVLGQFSW